MSPAIAVDIEVPLVEAESDPLRTALKCCQAAEVRGIRVRPRAPTHGVEYRSLRGRWVATGGLISLTGAVLLAVQPANDDGPYEGIAARALRVPLSWFDGVCDGFDAEPSATVRDLEYGEGMRIGGGIWLLLTYACSCGGRVFEGDRCKCGRRTR